MLLFHGEEFATKPDHRLFRKAGSHAMKVNRCRIGAMRRYLTVALALFLSACWAPISKNLNEVGPKEPIKIGLLHLELRYADIPYNSKHLEHAVRLAASKGAKWILTPELTLTGYRFDLKIGLDWIPLGPDQYVQHMQRVADELNVTVFLSHLERLPTGEIFNTLFVIDEQGKIIGRHRKINTIPIAEAWSTAGTKPTLVDVGGHKVGLLICADAWPQGHAEDLQKRGAQMLVSSATWPPGLHGPKDTWEKRSLETKLPVFVNNRTGIERDFDIRQAASVVVDGGQRLVSHTSEKSSVVLVDWNHHARSVVNQSLFVLDAKDELL